MRFSDLVSHTFAWSVELMTLAFHIVVVLLGGYLLYLTYVMHEAAEGKWVNRIEELWIRIDDRNKAVLDTTKVLFRVVAEKIEKVFNRIVGRKIASVRLVGISGSLSFACLFSFYGLALALVVYFVEAYSAWLKLHIASADKLENALPLVALACFVFFAIGFFCLVLAILPIIFKFSIWAWISCFPTLLTLLLFIRLLYLVHTISGPQLGLLIALPASLISDIFLLILTRQSLSWMLSRTSIVRMTVTLTIHLVLIYMLFVFPIQFMFAIAHNKSQIGMAVAMLNLAIFNIPTALASAAFILSLSIVLVHRVTWPLLSQWVYVLTRKDVLEKRKTIRLIAGIFIVYGLHGLPRMALVQKAIESFTK